MGRAELGSSEADIIVFTDWWRAPSTSAAARDSGPGLTMAMLACCLLQIKMIVVLGELGGTDEYSLVEALKEGKVGGRAAARVCHAAMWALW